jgi:hypothetical protein
MKFLRIAHLGVFVLAAAVFCYGQHGHGGGAGGGHMGGLSGGGGSMGDSGRSADHGSQSNSNQSGAKTPQQLLDQNSRLTSNLQKLLPAGTTPQQACSGFANLGRCVAAIHVAHNLGIPFSDLKAKITGTGSESLGKAIHDLKPQADANAEQKKGEKQAKDDLDGTES